MADRLVDLILKNIDKDKLLQVQYERLLVEYTRSLFNVTDSVFDDGYRSLLRYADLLSISELEIHNNLAQQIIILLGQLFPNEEEVAIFKESVYQNVSNFASLEFVKAKNDIIYSQTRHGAMRPLWRARCYRASQDRTHAEEHRRPGNRAR